MRIWGCGSSSSCNPFDAGKCAYVCYGFNRFELIVSIRNPLIGIIHRCCLMENRTKAHRTPMHIRYQPFIWIRIFAYICPFSRDSGNSIFTHCICICNENVFYLYWKVVFRHVIWVYVGERYSFFPLNFLNRCKCVRACIVYIRNIYLICFFLHVCKHSAVPFQWSTTKCIECITWFSVYFYYYFAIFFLFLFFFVGKRKRND